MVIETRRRARRLLEVGTSDTDRVDPLRPTEVEELIEAASS